MPLKHRGSCVKRNGKATTLASAMRLDVAARWAAGVEISRAGTVFDPRVAVADAPCVIEKPFARSVSASEVDLLPSRAAERL
jgi:hypothetical protein